jgi:CRP/FNR family cyclic AMP-dependent transcriptional regulator
MTDTTLLERVPLLAALPPRDRELLAAGATHRRFRRGDTIFQKEDPGQSLFIVETGAVRIYLPGSQGNDLTLRVMGAGDFFGDLSLLDGRPRSASAAAAADSTLLVLERSDFLNLITSQPETSMAVLAVVAQRLRDTDEMASDLAFLDAAGRLAKKLLELAGSHGVRTANGLLIDMQVTQEELANMIGVTRESVNRHLADFRREGLIASEGRRLVIRDSEALRARGQS